MVPGPATLTFNKTLTDGHAETSFLLHMSCFMENATWMKQSTITRFTPPHTSWCNQLYGFVTECPPPPCIPQYRGMSEVTHDQDLSVKTDQASSPSNTRHTLHAVTLTTDICHQFTIREYLGAPSLSLVFSCHFLYFLRYSNCQL